jgi:hypothetical protein
MLLITHFSGESWVLVPSVTPDEAKTSTPSTVEPKIESTTPSLTLSTLSENITNEVTSSEEISPTEKIRETTIEPTSSEEEEEEGEGEEESSAEYIGVNTSTESEEDETTTETSETESINVNLTSSTLTQFGNHTNQSLIS